MDHPKQSSMKSRIRLQTFQQVYKYPLQNVACNMQGSFKVRRTHLTWCKH